MAKNADFVKLVKQAQLGDSRAVDLLVRAARVRLRTDVYRLTFDQDLTQEIVQETLLEMFRILRDLREPDKFWPWLYKIALNKMRLNYRTKRRRKTVPIAAVDEGAITDSGQEVMANAVTQELREIVFAAMQHLKPRHRAVLSMRCYREMDYSAIADVMGCSEFAAKMLFYRAKKTLKKQLSRSGFGKGSLLMALLLFGKMTAPTEAAAAQISITAAAMEVGAAATLAGIATSKTAVMSAAAAGVLAVSTLVTTQQADRSAFIPPESSAITFNVASQARPGRTEFWYYYPPKSNGAVIMRLMKADSKNAPLYCQHLQNEEGNYHFDRRTNTIYINNARIRRGDMSVWLLPTDGAQLRAFLSQVEGKQYQTEYIPELKDGLMVVSKTEQETDHLWTTRQYNVLSEEYFRYNWPAGTRLADYRDTMHRRGWTYFTVSGSIDGQRVSGTGQVPFVYAASLQYPAWLKLRVGNLKIEDCADEARVYYRGLVVARYEGGTFLKGLARPWMGLHTIDTIRRDAADKQMRFETRHTPGSGKAEVEIIARNNRRLLYTIDLEKDVIEKIDFFASDNSRKGILTFSYLKGIRDAESKFIAPRKNTYRRAQRKSIGIQWLIRLMEGNLK